MATLGEEDGRVEVLVGKEGKGIGISFECLKIGLWRRDGVGVEQVGVGGLLEACNDDHGDGMLRHGEKCGYEGRVYDQWY